MGRTQTKAPAGLGRSEAAHAGEVPSSIIDVVRLWGELPKDLQQQIIQTVTRIWDVRAPLLWQVIAWVVAQSRMGIPVRTAVLRAGPRFGLPPRRSAPRAPGLSSGQIRQYGRRQQERGRRPGQDPRMRRYREAEAVEQEVRVRPRVVAICRESSRMADQIRAERLRAGSDPVLIRQLSIRANSWVKGRGHDMLSGRHDLRPEEIDLFVGCLARLEHAVGRALPAMPGIRDRAQRLLRFRGRGA